MIRRLSRDRRGAAALEFALLTPVLCGALFGVIETGRMLWMTQALSEAAFSTVRCKAVNKSRCETTAQQAAYARDRASANGVRIALSDVVIRSGVTCRGQAGSSEVVVGAAFTSPMSSVVGFPARVEARACLPTL